MRFPSCVLVVLLLLSGASVHAFSPQTSFSNVAKNAVFRKPAFTATQQTSTSNPMEGITLPEMKLPDVSLPSSPDGLVRDVVAILDKSSESLKTAFQTLVSTLQSALESANLPTEVLQEYVDKIQTALSSFVASHPEIQPLYNTIQEQFNKIHLNDAPSGVVIALSALISYSVISSILSLGQDPAPSQPYPDGKYNATSARAYFDDHVTDVIARGIQVATKSLGFGISLLQDKVKYVQNYD